jgi:hypothetical protein
LFWSPLELSGIFAHWDIYLIAGRNSYRPLVAVPEWLMG